MMICLKASYTSKAEANKTRGALLGKGRIGIHAYRCECGSWHLGHKRFRWLPGMKRP